MLLPIEVDPIPEERGCKRDLVWSGGSAVSKMVFTLLEKVITLHVGSTTIDVQGLGLKLILRSRSIF